MGEPEAISNRVRAFASVIVTLLFLNISGAHAATLITDEGIRRRVLAAVFPNATISVSPNRIQRKPAQEPSQLDALAESFKDALKQEQEYDIVGAVTKEEAEGPAADILTGRLSDSRRVRIMLFRWQSRSGDHTVLVAIVNYSFPQANPARCCTAAGKVMLLSTAGDQVLDTVDEMPNAFTTFTAVKFLDARRSGAEQLLLSVDFAGAGTIGVDTAIFDLSNGRIKPLAWLTTAVYSGLEKKDEAMFTMTLDEQKTLRSAGKLFWFTRRTYIRDGKKLSTPLTSTQSVAVGDKPIPLNW